MLKSMFGFVGKSKKSNGVATKEPPPKAAQRASKAKPTADAVSGAQAQIKKQVAPTVTRIKPSRIVDGQVQLAFYPEEQSKTLPAKYLDSVAGSAIVERAENSTETLDLVIATAYKQVFGNAHLMDSERCPKAESQVRMGEITIRDFIRDLAMSSRYRYLFWETKPTVTAIELNFKHLLGRPPKNSAEISEHIEIIAKGGYEAEIDSYLESDEYFTTFGDSQVPYLRGYSTEAGVSPIGYTRSFSLFGFACASDKSNYGADNFQFQNNSMVNAAAAIPEVRTIPTSFPAELIAEPTPRIPKEIRNIARQLWTEIEARQPTYY